MMGWRMSGEFPNVRKAVIILAPHTSNIDAVLTVFGILALRMHVSFFVKSGAFRWPFGGLMRWFGALPVNRDNSKDLVGYSAQKLQEKEAVLLAIAPEGTRDASSTWKTGFYWIAHKAGVPIVVLGLDYANRNIIFIKTLTPSGDIDTDLPLILESYRGIEPRHPERLSTPLKALRDSSEGK
jgi:1-acyl-sn-glycerol-3-phosphate acyltransferase